MMADLFPDTTYGVDSGGNPDNIPDLTYEDFQGFYKKIIIVQQLHLLVRQNGH